MEPSGPGGSYGYNWRPLAYLAMRTMPELEVAPEHLSCRFVEHFSRTQDMENNGIAFYYHIVDECVLYPEELPLNGMI